MAFRKLYEKSYTAEYIILSAQFFKFLHALLLQAVEDKDDVGIEEVLL